ncbi:MAG TPA: ribonuclease Y, partial [Nitrospiraceae bacterium]|nr:ribonuclease Y [Nitrospiraceae bacterium]
MIDTGYLLTSIAVGIALAIVLSLIYRRSLSNLRLSLGREKDELMEEAKKTAEAVKKEAALEAKDLVYQAKSEAEKEIKERRHELNQLDRRLRQKEEALERKSDQIEKREHELNKREKEYNARERTLLDRENHYSQIIKEQQASLERISGVSAEEARQELLRRVEEETRFEAAKLAKRIEDEARELADKKSKEIVSLAIQRYASDYVADGTVTAVSLPSDEMKGRIIGREGRNIRALEAATGVDLIVDDTPELVTLSAFDPVRREIARLSLERLITDGRIHPARIEEVVEKVKKEVEAIIKEEGEKAIFDLSLSGIHPELVRLLGRLKYRTSYGQNMLQHSREVAYLAGMMAAELGV